jgi:alpha-beta hydrolase superfamily lysophospholipase
VFDAEGNGCSSGLHGLCTSFDRWSVQAAEAAKFAQKRLREAAGDPAAADCPAFLMGESMGGALSINTVLQKPEMWAGMILIAPMCAISPELMPAWPVVQALRCMAVCCPGWAVVPMQDHLPNCFRNGHSYILERARSDPLRYAGVNRLGTGLQSLNVMDKIREQAADIRTPLLVMHGSADVVTDPHSSLRFWESTSSEDKTYVTFEDAWHVMWFDNYDNRVMALDMIDEWVSQRSSSSGESAVGAAAGKSDSLEPLRPAARILKASGSCMSEIMGDKEVPVPPGGPERCFWAVDSAAVEGDAVAGASSLADETPRLTLRLLEGPALPKAWADAPMRCKFPDAATLAGLAAAAGGAEPAGDAASEPERTSASV